MHIARLRTAAVNDAEQSVERVRRAWMRFREIQEPRKHLGVGINQLRVDFATGLQPFFVREGFVNSLCAAIKALKCAQAFVFGAKSAELRCVGTGGYLEGFRLVGLDRPLRAAG